MTTDSPEPPARPDRDERLARGQRDAPGSARTLEPAQCPGPGAVGKPPLAPGDPVTGPVTGRQGLRPVMPHERDESAGDTAAEPNPVIEQAARDLAAGQVDTDLRTSPGLDAARRADLAGEVRGDPKPARD